MQIRGASITHTLLPTLGVSVVAGRNFTEEEDQPNANAVVMLGHGAWQRHFGGDEDVIGRSIQLNGNSREVVGVLPPRFRLPSEFGDPLAAEIFIPMGRQLTTTQPGAGSQNFNLVARMQPGIATESGDRNIRETMEAIQTEFNWPEGFSGLGIPLHETVVGDVRSAPESNLC